MMTKRWTHVAIVVLLAAGFVVPAAAEPVTNPVDTWLDWLGDIWASWTSSGQGGAMQNVTETIGGLIEPNGQVAPMGGSIEPFGEPSTPGSCSETGPYGGSFGGKCGAAGLNGAIGTYIPNGSPTPSTGDEVAGVAVPIG